MQAQLEQLVRLIEAEYFGNSVRIWAIALGVAIVTVAVLMLARRIVRGRLERIAPRTQTSLDDMILELVRRTMGGFLVVVGLYAGMLVLAVPERLRSIVHSVLVIALLLQAGRWGATAMRFYLGRYRKEKLQTDPSGLATLNILNFVGLALIWAIVVLLTLDNLGFNVTTLLAGLGIGGVAVALAAQRILSDLFASLSIALDKPFAVKDFLIVGEFLGSVENIGIKTTRLRSLSGEQIVFSNTDLLDSRIRNYGRLFERRIAFTIGVTYQTPREKLEKIPTLLRQAVESNGDKVRFDRSHFKSYGAYSLDFETVYYVLGPDYALYMDCQQAINLWIHAAFEKEAIEFAYPTQTLFIERSQPSEPGAVGEQTAS